MDPKTQILAITGSIVLLGFVLELVRRRRLKEEYSVLWVLTSIVIVVLAVWYQLLLTITDVIGAVLPSSTLFFFGLLFALAMLLNFSVRVSMLERRMTLLVQELGLLTVDRRADGAVRLPGPDAPAPEDRPATPVA
jgi:hypothetical protein